MSRSRSGSFVVVLSLAASLLTALACGCSPTPESSSNALATPGSAPELGKADSSDAADGACSLVLRDVSRSPGNFGGFETDCSSGNCFIVWTGSIDVSTAALTPGATVGVLFHLAWDPMWWEADATPVGTGEAGMQRFAFRLADHTVSDGMSTTSLNRTDLELAPFVRNAAGGRLFDHNRNRGAFDNYHLVMANFWALADDPHVCNGLAPGQAAILFTGDFRDEVIGKPTAGNRVSVRYDVNRLPQCRGTHNGFPAWDTRAFVRFTPGGQTVDGSVRAFDAPGGVPQNVPHAVPFDVDIPADATGMQVWFHNFTGAGSSCEAWDSNFGQNYSFAVAAAPWVGNFTSLLTRDDRDPCAGGTALTTDFHFDSWARQRAIVTNACFEVWQAGVTDFDNPNLWRELDVEIHYSYLGSAAGGTGTGTGMTAATQEFVSTIGRAGNNAKYAFDLRHVDPFRPFHCPEAPVTTVTVDGNAQLQATIGYYFTVNGLEIRPAGATTMFHGQFTDNPGDSWRAANCP